MRSLRLLLLILLTNFVAASDNLWQRVNPNISTAQNLTSVALSTKSELRCAVAANARLSTGMFCHNAETCWLFEDNLSAIRKATDTSTWTCWTNGGKLRDSWN